MGKTYPKVIEKLKEDVPAKYSRNEFCRRAGINPNSFDRYIAGISEPTGTTLRRLANFWGISVAELRGEEPTITVSFTRENMITTFKGVDIPISVPVEIIKKVGTIIVLAILEDASNEDILREIERLKREIKDASSHPPKN